MRDDIHHLEGLLQLHQAEHIITKCKSLLRKQKSPRLYLMLANAFLIKHDYEATMYYQDKACRLVPRDPDVLFEAALNYLFFGKNDEAREFLLKAINIREDNMVYHKFFSSIETYDDENSHFKSLMAMEDRFDDFSSQNKIHYCFTMFNIYRALGDYETSFRYLSSGNSLKRSLITVDLAKEKALFDSLKMNSSLSASPKNFIPQQGGPSPAPIFIIGMPRSGTTIIENLISQNPNVTAAGELPFLNRLYKATFRNADLRDMANFRNEYFLLLSGLGITSSHFTDKMPTNFRFVPFIHAAFSDARILHVKRDPLATCFSIYSNDFDGNGLTFAYDLSEIGAYYNLYEKMMGFWAQKFGDRMLEINLEDLIENPSTVGDGIFTFLGLDWDDRYLELNNRSISNTTASAHQIRQGLLRKPSTGWKNYKPYLAPLEHALDGGGNTNQ
jgi:tetratricopeptide (TPR) repeat protein